MPFEHVLVVGAGQMGGGIAQVVAASGRRVSLHDAAPGAVERGLATIERSLAKLAGKGGADPAGVLERIEPVGDLTAADLMIEAVVEDSAVKEEIFRRADEVLPAGAVLASNTSSIPITSLGAVTSRPEQVIGMHFFNPVPVLKLVEVIRGLETSDASSLSSSARSPRRRATCPGSSRTGSSCRSSTKPRTRSWKASRRPTRSTRSRSSGSPTRWGLWRWPT